MDMSTQASSGHPVTELVPKKHKKGTDNAAGREKLAKGKPDKARNRTKERRFTLHVSDYDLMDELKALLRKGNRVVKKSDLVIAGLHALGRMPIDQLQMAIDDVRSVRKARKASASDRR